MIIAPGRVTSKGKCACLRAQRARRDRRATEAVEERQERLSSHRGVQRQHDRKGTETEAQEEKCCLKYNYNQWDRSRSPKMLSIRLVLYYVDTKRHGNESLLSGCGI